MPRRRIRAGFTLLEIASVVAIIGILIGIGAPSYQVYQNRARTAEATINLETIASLELVALLETGAPIACEARPASLPAPRAPFVPTESWRALGFVPTSQVRFQYEVQTSGEDFTAHARGDLDHDGVSSHHSISSLTMKLQAERPGE